MGGYTTSDKVLHGISIWFILIGKINIYIDHLLKNAVGSVLSAWL